MSSNNETICEIDGAKTFLDFANNERPSTARDRQSWIGTICAICRTTKQLSLNIFSMRNLSSFKEAIEELPRNNLLFSERGEKEIS